MRRNECGNTEMYEIKFMATFAFLVQKLLFDAFRLFNALQNFLN